MQPAKNRIAVLKSNGARFVITNVTDTHITLKGWIHTDTLTLRDYAIRYRTGESCAHPSGCTNVAREGSNYCGHCDMPDTDTRPDGLFGIWKR